MFQLIFYLLLLRSGSTKTLDNVGDKKIQLLSLGYDYSQYQFAKEIYEESQQLINNNLFSDEIDDGKQSIITFNKITDETLMKICEDFNTLIIYKSETAETINCENYKNYENIEIVFDDISESGERDKRNVLEEGSGDEPENENRTTEPPIVIINETTEVSKDYETKDITNATVNITTEKPNLEIKENTTFSVTTTENITEVNETIENITNKVTDVTDNVTSPPTEKPILQSKENVSEKIEPKENDNKEIETTTKQISDKNENLSSNFAPKNDTVSKKSKSSLSGGSDKTNLEEPKNQESSKPNKASAKDSTILIVLFACVVGVGVLAFGYNFIKKKRRQRNNSSSNNDNSIERGGGGGNSAIRRSLQSLTQKTNEAATTPEYKPLLKQEQEMVEIKNGKAAIAELASNVTASAESKNNDAKT